MLSFLKNHPFAVSAYFESSLVLSFAVKKEVLQTMLPPHLELDTFENTWGFVAVAMVQTKDLRPKGFPKFLGNDFFLIGYRIFVRYTNKAGKRLRGLYILKSETDKKKMEYLGSIFTHYNYSTTDITQTLNKNILEISSKHSDFNVKVDTQKIPETLPQFSPFNDWKEARRFAGPLPFTFSFLTEKKEMLIIEGQRENWVPRPIQVTEYHFAFLKTLGLEHTVLSNAFEIKNIPYTWKKGSIEKWD